MQYDSCTSPLLTALFALAFIGNIFIITRMKHLKRYIIKSFQFFSGQFFSGQFFSRQFVFALNISPLIFALLFSWVLLLDMLERNGHLQTPDDTLFVFIYITILLLVQYFIVKKIKRHCKHVNIYHGIVTLLFVLNVASLYLLNYGKYLQASFLWQTMILLIVAGVFYFVIKYSEKWVFFIILLVLYTVFFADAFLGKTKMLDKMTRTITTVPLPENYTSQEFIKKPNVYLLSFDAMIPKNVARNLLELAPEETPGYFDVLEKNDMQIIPNAFSARPASRTSFSSMLALDLDWYTQLYGYEKFSGANMMEGMQWSPTYDIFDRNGYGLRVIHFFDTDNNGMISKKIKTGRKGIHAGFCGYFDSVYPLWGYCGVRKILLNVVFENDDRDVYNEIFYEQIESATLSETPVFLLSYAFLPKHTADDYDANKRNKFEDYKRKFMEKSILAGETLQKYLDVITSNDEDAIIIVFGDHGAYITAGARDGGTNNKYTEKDILQDDHAVVLAVRDQHHGCQDKIAEPIVTTLPDMMHNLITCLTGGKPVLKDRYNSEADFIDYLYDPIPNK